MEKIGKVEEKENQDYKYQDVKGKIREKMREAVLLTINSGREMNWDKFLQFCIDFGMIEPPNLLTVPISVIEECFKEVKEEFDNGKKD